MSVEDSPAGEPASSTESSDKDSSVVCPTCDRDDFKNRHGMRIHHAQAHGESISWVETNCDTCGIQTEIEQYEYEKQENVYCSPKCQHKGLEEKVEVSCSWCGDTEKVIASRVERYNYCSTPCKAQKEAEEWVGENGPNYRKGVLVTCKQCGTTKRFPPSREDREFCGARCHYQWRSDNIRGEDHPNWRGGWDEYYGPNWKAQRRKARKRDHYQCQICRKDERDLGKIPSCHHLTKIRKFKEWYDAPEWYEKGNRLDNLVLLCEEHHKEWEGVPLFPQVD